MSKDTFAREGTHRAESTTGGGALASIHSAPHMVDGVDMPSPFTPTTIATGPSRAAESPSGVRVNISLTVPAWVAWPGWRRLLAPALAFLVVAGYFVVRQLVQVVPEGDSTLHLHFMELIANGQLPTTVPHFAAIVQPGGEVEAWFPYSYPLLYHAIGGGLFKIGGESLAAMIGPVSAGLAAVGIVYLLREQPWPAKALAATLPFLQWITQPVMAWVYMEPMMLAFLVGALCFYQRMWTGGSHRDAIITGAFLGLAVATRQNALFYVAFFGVHAAGTLLYRMHVDPRQARAFIGHSASLFGTAALVALPFLLYLIWNTGSIGYSDVAVPGFSATLPADPEAVEYLRSFSVPLSGPLEWVDQFWHWTLFTSRWQIGVLTYIPLPLFVLGLVYLAQQSRAGVLLATYIPIHVLGEMFQLMTVHGNWRYIVASRVLFYVVVALGIYFAVSWIYRKAREQATWPAVTGPIAAALAIGVIAPGFVTPSLVDYLANQESNRTERGESFRELGAYVDEHVPEDALLLSGRWYTTGYYLRRDYTWVTYYGNTWVIDAISNTNPAVVRSTLERYGIDYVVFQAPPPSYLDSMPSGGLRTIVLDDLDHYQLLFKNERTRLYKFWPDGIVVGEE